jgi:hypothetical protein
LGQIQTTLDKWVSTILLWNLLKMYLMDWLRCVLNLKYIKKVVDELQSCNFLCRIERDIISTITVNLLFIGYATARGNNSMDNFAVP